MEKQCSYCNIQNFSDKSTIHGFQDLYYAKSIVWKIIWLFLIVAAIGISIFQLHNLVKETIDEPTTTIIKPLSDEIKYPPLSICYIHWVYWINWTRVIELGFDKPSALHGLGMLTDVKSSEFFNMTEAKTNFTQAMNKNGFTKLSQFYIAIARDEPFGFQRDSIEEQNNGYQISSFKFKKTFGHRIDNVCYVATGDMIKTELETNTAGMNEIQFEYDTDYFIPDGVYLTQSEYEAYVLERMQSISSETIPSNRWNFSSFRVSPMLNVDGIESNFMMMEENTVSKRITISSTLNIWLNNGNPKCNDDESMRERYSYCRTFCLFQESVNNHANSCIGVYKAAVLGIDTIEKVCERNVYFLDSNVSVIRKQKYVEQQPTTQSFNSCIDHFCMVPCNEWKYASTVNLATVPSQLGSIALKSNFIISYPSRSSVLVMKQVESQSWESIVGTVGGIVGLWLGASVMSVVQMVYLLCCGECDRRLSAFKKEKRNQSITSIT